MAVLTALVVAGLYLAHRAAAIASSLLPALPFQVVAARGGCAVRYHVR